MHDITDYVLDESLRRTAEWRAGGCDATVSVNISASVLQDAGFPRRVIQRLALRGVPSSCLVLELTETAVMSDPARCQRVLEELHQDKVGLSLDDYGTGYASLTHLVSLPVDEIKIDKEFVLGMAGSPTDRAIVQSLLDLARAMGLRVVAEGVENEEIGQRLKDLGCRFAQGYHYGRPIPAADVADDYRRAASSDGLSGVSSVDVSSANVSSVDVSALDVAAADAVPTQRPTL
jgi:diguanylate cyclase